LTLSEISKSKVPPFGEDPVCGALCHTSLGLGEVSRALGERAKPEKEHAEQDHDDGARPERTDDRA